MMVIIIATLFTIVLSSSYLWLKWRYLYWEYRRVPHLRTESLLFGNNRDAVVGRLSAAENTLKLYEALAPHRFGGVYNFYRPVLYIRDPALIKNVLIKHFAHFHDRNFRVFSEKDPLWSQLSTLVGEEWKVLRQRLTPAFTSGKIRLMFELMKKCAEKLEKIAEKCALERETTNVKELMARYITDGICSIAFGIEVDSLHNPDSEFLTKAKQILIPSRERRLKDALLSLNPALARFLGFKRYPRSTNDFFINLMRATMEYRRKHDVDRKDFLTSLLSSPKEGTEKTQRVDFTVEVLTAQSFTFFVSGFETGSNILSFTLYELSEYLDVQTKIIKEIDRVLSKYEGQITYDGVQEMHYMDKVLNEVFRLFPPAPILWRICTKDYRIPDSDYIVKRGDSLIIPIHGLHRDPQYFPNPDIFDPENFSEERIAARPSCCFMPFGDGPRNCIAIRFVVMQLKLALIALLKGHTVSLASEMKLPLELMTYSVLTTPKNPILVNFTRRDSTESGHFVSV